MMKCSKRKRTGTVSEQPTTTDNTNKWELASSASHLVSNYQQQMINENNCYFRSDIGGPLNLKIGDASNNFYDNNKGQQQMQPPSYPINDDANRIQEIIKNSAYNQQAATAAAVNYLAQLSQHQPFNFMPTTTTSLTTTTTTAAPSSYYTLTPASSTTSLHDFALLNSTNLEKKPARAHKSSLSRTDSKKRCRTATIENIEDQSSTTANLKKAAATVQQQDANGTAIAAPRRRGRPPKNAATTSTSQLPKQEPTEQVKAPESITRAKAAAASNLTRSNSSIDSSTTSKYKSNKLIKNLINKSSSNSNLQKSKVQTTTTVKPDENKPHEPLVNKSNLINNVNVNTTKVNQSQITGYFVDKVNTSLNTNNDYTALKIAGVNLVKPLVANSENNNSQLNSVNQSIYTGYYNKVQSIRSVDVSLTTEEYKPAEVESKTPMPKLSWANNHELWETMLRKDAKYIHDPFYLKRHVNIEPQMRAILLDWLVEISYAYRLHRETWHLALEYMDRFMTCCKQQMRVDRLQLIGMTCLFLAAKVEEIYPPKLKELASHMENYSNNNEDAISQFELFILKTLSWEISPVTANTWLMTYIQIASLNYYSILKGTQPEDQQPLNSHMVMPLNIYKNSNANKLKATHQQQQFYVQNYMKSVTLLDLCMFEMNSLKFSYSVLAASAMYHMISYDCNSGDQFATPLHQSASSQQLAAKIVEMSTGYKLYELDACIKWMYPFADVCKEILTEEKMTFVKTFSSVDNEDSHNIQLYHQNLELLKEAQARKTPCKSYSNQNIPPVILTPPDSHRKFSSSSQSSSTACAYNNMTLNSSTSAVNY